MWYSGLASSANRELVPHREEKSCEPVVHAQPVDEGHAGGGWEGAAGSHSQESDFDRSTFSTCGRSMQIMRAAGGIAPKL